MLPGIQRASYAMPDAHWGYGFPIGGVAAFDPEEGGIVSAGGVGFDISCGVRTLRTGLTADSIEPDALDAMLKGGARWAVQSGYGIASPRYTMLAWHAPSVSSWGTSSCPSIAGPGDWDTRSGRSS